MKNQLAPLYYYTSYCQPLIVQMFSLRLDCAYYINADILNKSKYYTNNLYFHDQVFIRANEFKVLRENFF